MTIVIVIIECFKLGENIKIQFFILNILLHLNYDCFCDEYIVHLLFTVGVLFTVASQNNWSENMNLSHIVICDPGPQNQS